MNASTVFKQDPNKQCRTSLISIKADLTLFPGQESCVNPQMCGYKVLKVFFVSSAFMCKHFSTSSSDTCFKECRSGIHVCNAFYHLQIIKICCLPICPYPCLIRKGENPLNFNCTDFRQRSSSTFGFFPLVLPGKQHLEASVL